MSLKQKQRWFHGSSLELKTLRTGSTITQIEKLAQVFSTGPGIVSVSDDGKIRHDGKLKGRVYRIIDEVNTDDIYEHPRSTMKKGWEWITKKEFKLEFLYEYEVSHYPDEILSESEIGEIRGRTTQS